MTQHRRLSLIINGALLCFICILVFQSADIAKYNAHRHNNRAIVSGEQTFLSDVDIRVSPGREDWLIQKIDSSTQRAWVNVYTFTLPWLRESLLRAQKRWVDVRVLLEKNPYNTVTINRETIQFLREHKISFHESDEKQFSFMHAKYMVFDSQWIIETANWTRSSFSENREFFVVGDDASILSTLTGIFEQDFNGLRGISRDIRVLAGPTNARERLWLFLDRSHHTIDIYVPSFTDTEMLDHIAKLCHAGVKTRVLLSAYEDQDTVYDSCLQVRFMKKPLHAKVILSDGGEGFFGSFNFTKNSLENNREVWIFLSGKKIIQIAQIFENDWQHAEVALGKK